jgi:tRNA (guanine-N1)-methyltransferase
MNTYNVITLFPNLIEEWKNIGIVRQAIKNQLVNIQTTNLREFGIGEYKQVDDAPYGGGPGMVLMPEPLDNAINSSNSEVNVFLTPSGEQLDETLLIKLLSFKSINLIAGRYEGFDQRILDMHADYKVSIGHTVISGGEVPAMYMLEALIRRIPGVLGNPDSLKHETFNDNKYDFPVYTRPETFKNLSVPEVLLSGNHKDIEEWKKNNLKDI